MNPTNQNRSTPQLTTDSRDLMEIDLTDMTHHVSQHQPINNLLDDTLTQNPWMEIDNTNQPQIQHLDNVAHI